MDCSPTVTNASSNLSKAPVDQRIVYADFLFVYKFYVGIGSFAVATNIIAIVTVLSNKHMREKYGTFGVLSFGDMLNAISLVLAGAVRSSLIEANVYFPVNSFQCFGRPWPYFFIVGGQLPSFVLLFMSAERLLAISYPLIYRTYVTGRTRIISNAGCVLLSVVSLIVGICFSYLNRDICGSAACTVIGATGRAYGTFNYAVIIFLPFIALLFNCVGFLRAWRMNASANMRKELKKVFAMMVIAAVAVVLSAVPNIFLWGQGVYWTVTNTSTSVLFLGFCSNSAINLFAFVILKEDFRIRLLSLISCGYVKRYSNSSEIVGSHFVNRRMVQNVSGARHVTR